MHPGSWIALGAMQGPNCVVCVQIMIISGLGHGQGVKIDDRLQRSTNLDRHNKMSDDEGKTTGQTQHVMSIKTNGTFARMSAPLCPDQAEDTTMKKKRLCLDHSGWFLHGEGGEGGSDAVPSPRTSGTLESLNQLNCGVLGPLRWVVCLILCRS